LLGHWVFRQLPRVLACLAVWLVGSHLGLMPSLRQSFASGGSWRRVALTGLIATAIFLVLTVAIGAAAGGTFGFHPYFPKMAGDLVSNMYEEIVYRGRFVEYYYEDAPGGGSAIAVLGRNYQQFVLSLLMDLEEAGMREEWMQLAAAARFDRTAELAVILDRDPPDDAAVDALRKQIGPQS
jgi:hypothetical protein